MVSFFNHKIESLHRMSCSVITTSEILKYTRSNILKKEHPCKRSHWMAFASKGIVSGSGVGALTMQGGIDRIEIWYED